MTADLDEVLTPAEAAAWLKVPESTLRQMLRDGRLARTQVGRHVRVTRRAVCALLDGGTDEASRPSTPEPSALVGRERVRRVVPVRHRESR